MPETKELKDEEFALAIKSDLCSTGIEAIVVNNEDEMRESRNSNT